MPIKILTFNIHKGLNATQSKFTLFEIRDLLNEIDADIVFLQEVQGVHRKNKDKFADWPDASQTEFLAGEQWPYHHYGKNHSHKHGHHGNSILSKFPLLNLSNVDISASRFSDRGLLYAKVDHLGTPLHLMCTHLGLLKKERHTQFSTVNQFIIDHIAPEEALVLAGDFNDWQSSALEHLSETIKLKEIFLELNGTYARSYPAELPLLKVDRIYYRGLTPLDCNSINSKNISDHRPLLARFEFIT